MAHEIHENWDKFAELTLEEEGITVRTRVPRGPGGLRQSARVRGRLDLTAAARPLEVSAHGLPLDDDERRHRCDPEAFDEVWPLFLGDTVELERLVVPASLQNLSEESLGTPAGAGHTRVEEDQVRAGAARTDAAA